MYIYNKLQLLCMEKPYMDENWIFSKYIGENLSTYEIAQICNVSSECIRIWLKRFGILRRDAYKSNASKYTPELEEFIIGSMLGDGSLIWGCNGISAYFSLSGKYKEYLEYIEFQLKRLGILRRGKLEQYTGEFGSFYLLQSKYYRGYFACQRELWYPNGKKTLPNGIKITPNILRMLYIEDGSLSLNYRKKRVETVSLFLNDFELNDVEIIRDLISLELGVEKAVLHINPNKPAQYGILMHKREVILKFFNYIGACPDEIMGSFGYKWPIIEGSIIDYNWRNSHGKT